MNILSGFNSNIITLTLMVFVVITLIVLIYLSLKIKKFQKAYITLQTTMDGKNIDFMLQEHNRKIEELQEFTGKNEVQIRQIENYLKKSIDRVKLVRYDAFQNVGGELSFAFAIMNSKGDGVVVNSIHSREDSRVYAKEIIEGKCKTHLSNEEKEVIEKALKENGLDII